MSQANGSSPVISHSLQGYDPHLFIKRPVFQQLRRNIFHFQKHIKVDEYKSRKKLMVKQFHSILKSDLSFGKTWTAISKAVPALATGAVSALGELGINRIL